MCSDRNVCQQTWQKIFDLTFTKINISKKLCSILAQTYKLTVERVNYILTLLTGEDRQWLKAHPWTSHQTDRVDTLLAPPVARWPPA